MFEAQQAHHYGLPDNLALASVTSEPAKAMGLDHRIGYVKAGWDAGKLTLEHKLTCQTHRSDEDRPDSVGQPPFDAGGYTYASLH